MKWPLYVWGDVGVGKSCAALAVCDHVRGAEFFTFGEFADLFQSAKFGRLATTHQRAHPTVERCRESFNINWDTGRWWRWIASLPLVVIDDFGTRGNATKTEYDAMFTLLERRANLPLIITSNLSIEMACELFDARIQDRIEPGTRLRIQGESRR